MSKFITAVLALLCVVFIVGKSNAQQPSDPFEMYAHSCSSIEQVFDFTSSELGQTVLFHGSQDATGIMVFTSRTNWTLWAYMPVEDKRDNQIKSCFILMAKGDGNGVEDVGGIGE